jgi:hypothetical protein
MAPHPLPVVRPLSSHWHKLTPLVHTMPPALCWPRSPVTILLLISIACPQTSLSLTCQQHLQAAVPPALATVPFLSH